MSSIRCHLSVSPLLGVVALLTMLQALLCLASANNNNNASANIENDILHFSYELEQWLDVEKRPCDDFYAYVCGKSVKTTQAQIAQRLQQEQQKFDQFLTSDNDEALMDAELKVKQFYSACKSPRSIEDLKSTLLYRVSGGWPAIDTVKEAAAMASNRRNSTWMSVLSIFHDAGLHYFFETTIAIKSNKRVVHLQPVSALRFTLRKFEQLADEMLQDIGDADRGRLVALETLRFERNRREIVQRTDYDEEREFTYADLKQSQLGNFQSIDWDSYFKKIVGKPLKPTDTIVVLQMSKMVQLFELLQNTTITRLLNWIWVDYMMDKGPKNCQSLVLNYFDDVFEHIVARSAIDKVQMAQMYADMGRVYDELLFPTPWIDEMSQQNSKQILGRIMHLTLNGDANLDAYYKPLQIKTKNFYRKVEKVHRFLASQASQNARDTSQTKTADVARAGTEFMRIFQSTNTLLRQQNLTLPLNYMLVGKHFGERMIAGGSSSATPGAWRSMDSERQYEEFVQCMRRQSPADATSGKYNLNDLLLRLLAQHQTLHALDQWLEKDARLLRRLESLLAAGRLQLTLRRLYFIGSLLATDCQTAWNGGNAEQKELVHSYLRNSEEFSRAFGCREGEQLYTRNVCKVL